MSRAWRTTLTPGHVLPAPSTGIDLGMTKTGPLTVRLFRQQGTRAMVYAAPYVAQLIALRSGAAGAAVRIVTGRQNAWAGVARHGTDTQFFADNGHTQFTAFGRGDSTLIIDDRGDIPRPMGEVAEWQCLLQICAFDQTRPDLTRLSGLTHADVAFLDDSASLLANEIGQIFGLGPASASLTVIPQHAVAVVTRGQVRIWRPELTSAERSALQG